MSSRSSTICAIPIRAGLFSSIPLPGADRFALPTRSPFVGNCHCRATGLAITFGPRCDFFVAGRCDKPVPMLDIKGDPGAAGRVACAMTRSTGSSIAPKGSK